MADVSLVIITWNSASEVGEMLASVADHLGAAAPEVIVVDNASSDDTLDVVARLAPDTRTIALPDNRGYGAAANIGVAAASAPVTAILNPDLVFPDGSLLRLVEEARTRDVILGPRLLDPDGSWQISAFTPVGGWEAVVHSLVPVTVLPAPLRRRVEPWRVDGRADAGWLSGACLVASTELLRDLGPFDERLHLYGEDIDLSLRAQGRGVATVFAPEARVIHLGHRSAGQRFNDRGLRAKIAARTWAVDVNRGPLIASLDWVLQLVGVLTRLIAKSVARRDAGFEAAYVHAALTRPRALRRAPRTALVAHAHRSAGAEPPPQQGAQ